MDTIHRERRLFALAVWIGICFLAAAVGNWATGDAITTWYPSLAKPSWTPPNWLFGPVWTALFIMMGVAAWWIWVQFGWRGGRVPLTLFLMQLGLNAYWSRAFFGLRQPGYGLFVILLLWMVLTVTTIAFGRADRRAGLLLLPYLAWVTFAAALNFELWRLNA